MTTTTDPSGAAPRVLAVGDEVLVRAVIVEDWGGRDLKVRVTAGPGFRISLWVTRETIIDPPAA